MKKNVNFKPILTLLRIISGARYSGVPQRVHVRPLTRFAKPKSVICKKKLIKTSEPEFKSQALCFFKFLYLFVTGFLLQCQLQGKDSVIPIFAPFTIQTFVQFDDSDANIQFCNKSTSLFFAPYVNIMPKMRFLNNCQILP